MINKFKKEQKNNSKFSNGMQKQAKEKIKALVEKYEKIRRSGKLKSYTEEETKKDLILFA